MKRGCGSDVQYAADHADDMLLTVAIGRGGGYAAAYDRSRRLAPWAAKGRILVLAVAIGSKLADRPAWAPARGSRSAAAVRSRRAVGLPTRDPAAPHPANLIGRSVFDTPPARGDPAGELSELLASACSRRRPRGIVADDGVGCSNRCD